jgi:purine-nucleoside phosphorylase
MNKLVAQLQQAVDVWQELDLPRPRVHLVSGSGLAVDLAAGEPPTITMDRVLPFPAHSLAGHPHQIQVLELSPGCPVLYQRGRLHSYQGYDAHQTVFMVRLAALLGAETLIMTNAAGGLRPDMTPGDLVLIRDHLNLSGMNPLRGELPPDWGPQFPDMTTAYDPELRRRSREIGAELGLSLGEGVYAGLGGPSYETPAEVAMLHRMGADLVGMSTVLEVITARHMGLRCLCLSLVSNLAAGVSEETLTHDEVLTAGDAAAADVRRLLRALLVDDVLTGGSKGAVDPQKGDPSEQG